MYYLLLACVCVLVDVCSFVGLLFIILLGCLEPDVLKIHIFVN